MIKGINVSEFQNKIDFEKEREDGLNFAILRCGYGIDNPNQDDKSFKRNLEECEQLHIPVGSYLYSYANSTAKASSEAEHTLRLVAGHKMPMGIWYFIEDDNTCGNVSNMELSNIINRYCSIIEDSGYKVGIYTKLSWIKNKIDKSIKEKYPIIEIKN